MAVDAVVSVLAEKLANLLIQEAVFFHGMQDQIEWVKAKLIRMQCLARHRHLQPQESTKTEESSKEDMWKKVMGFAGDTLTIEQMEKSLSDFLKERWYLIVMDDLHLVRDLLLSKTKEANFVHVYENIDSTSTDGVKIRRHAAHYTVSKLSSFTEHLRSFLVFNSRTGGIDGDIIGGFLDRCLHNRGFRFLKVLDLEGVFRPTLPEALGELIHLRYLGLRRTTTCHLTLSLGNLRNLGTLDLKNSKIWSPNGQRKYWALQSRMCNLFPSDHRDTWISKLSSQADSTYDCISRDSCAVLIDFVTQVDRHRDNEIMISCMASSGASESQSAQMDTDCDINDAAKLTRSLRQCTNCQKVTARWHPEDACMPVLEEVPVFYPTEEEFRDTLKYIAGIRPRAEPYGICRIVPPPSWKPLCLLKEKNIWENSKFATHIQRVDKLQNHDSLRKMSRIYSNMKKKKRQRGSSGLECGIGNGDIMGPAEAGSHAAQSFDSGGNLTALQKQLEPSVENIEGEYWPLVEKPTEEIEVLYGADLETGVAVDFQMSVWQWISKSVLFIILFLVEDHHLYLSNYMHWSAPKMWYGILGSDSLKLDAAVKKYLPDLFEEQPDLIHKLVTQLSSTVLKSKGVPIYRCVQHPREFVLTFPRAYHSGFNCGFNPGYLLERNAVELYREQGRKTSISHDKLLLGAARESVRAHWKLLLQRKNTLDNLRWKDVCGKDGILAKALKTRVELECMRREYLCTSSQSRKMDISYDAISERECSVCLYDLHMSAMCCQCPPERDCNLHMAKLDLRLALSSYVSKDNLQVTGHVMPFPQKKTKLKEHESQDVVTTSILESSIPRIVPEIKAPVSQVASLRELKEKELTTAITTNSTDILDETSSLQKEKPSEAVLVSKAMKKSSVPCEFSHEKEAADPSFHFREKEFFVATLN
ncbi:hypothetical protein HHK36_025375 [Tetracentron sinense]|uniref:Uncharacterized protein n=1 Tax=Tetracentron sinense TaxID=13715 RepID=A0A834YL87_TETSI|nr:hypothetical protein HHK36_025375 [Tetracentron sinense]